MCQGRVSPAGPARVGHGGGKVPGSQQLLCVESNRATQCRKWALEPGSLGSAPSRTTVLGQVTSAVCASLPSSAEWGSGWCRAHREIQKMKRVTTVHMPHGRHPASCLVRSGHHGSDGCPYSPWGFCHVSAAPAGLGSSGGSCPEQGPETSWGLCLHTVDSRWWLPLWASRPKPTTLLWPVRCQVCDLCIDLSQGVSGETGSHRFSWSIRGIYGAPSVFSTVLKMTCFSKMP